MEVKRLFDVLHYQKQNHPQQVALATIKNGDWWKTSTDELINLSNNLSLGLLKLGIQKGDKVAVVTSANRTEWNICDQAIGQIGAINVPLYPTISTNDYKYILGHSEAKICIVSDAKLYDKVKDLVSEVEGLQAVYTFDQVEGAKNYDEIMKLGEGGNVADIKAISDSIQPTELATLIYTSGTTGQPKGVMLSHSNIISNVLTVRAELPIEAGHTALSFLPLCHIFERMVIYTYLHAGANVYYSDVDTLKDKLGTVRPHFFTTVPRLLEKVYEGIVNKGLALTGLKKKLFFWALEMADNYEYDQKPSFLFKIADKLIFSKWREGLGGRIMGIVTGSAACPLKMARVFSAAGIPIREGYGLTETSPVLTFNRFAEGGAMLGTVGMPIKDVEIKIAEEDSEILAKGPNIMMGYYKEPEKTREVLTEDGWFSTGDVGTFVTNNAGNKFLKITDRKKELLKTSGGKYVAPAPIESKFRENFFVEQIMVVGESKKFVSALIVPAFPVLEQYAKENGITFASREDLIANPSVQAKFQSIIDELNPNFSHIEQIKKFKLLKAEWTPETTELTPTMKLKRKVINEKFGKEIESIYND
ncbi:MAG TPA: long-chain fatty acid--CoA ligase [Chitinophagales bacterium]|jgi:long-chain acyl-CoA synthetase|nr:long-chain fatty acid--CoA ligase [Chitinophagales bacterium]MBP6154519.1 long-chain fatty acid--CoA ligase [Chitinophagales bacterium]HQV79260.1 long-chain fatty acid--CoA ligase [Chitinophagales bacterium]HQW80060.1 long-chain fatty acid--CoA ligase [Chitinophagales bacterium]HRB66237.1 long-chain fatty acid--CoA ligase [Chitinophagales bacterium]